VSSQIALGRPQAVARKQATSMTISFKVNQKHLTAFTRQLATLLDAGLPLMRSLDILQNQIPPGLLKSAVAAVREDVEGGSALSEALARHPAVFDKLYVNMIRAGEAGGVMDLILSRLADYREKAQRLQQKIAGAMIYPAAVITIAGCILGFIMVFIIPRFEVMFQEMNIGPMPLMTELLMFAANTLVKFWYLLIFLPPLLWTVVNHTGKTAAGRLFLDKLKLKLPVFGIIISKSAISRFCRTLGTLVQSGVPILEALSIIKNATGNQVVANAIEKVHESIKEGDTIAEPLRYSGVFDDLVVNMIQVGEETGELDKMLFKIADTYDNEVDTLVGAMMSLLEPFMIVAMGGAVGFIVIGLFMPLIKIMEDIGRS
jgi:type IV pilus assembly protein PilC